MSEEEGRRYEKVDNGDTKSIQIAALILEAHLWDRGP